MRLKQTHPCPHCQSEYTVKNGKTHYGKQNHKCKLCKRQFVERQNSSLESFKEDMLPLLLLERLSLRGISRVLGKSLTWISNRTKSLWTSLPEDLPIGKLEDATLDLYCLEADEMWSFVGAKDCPAWVWLAVERHTRLVVGYHVGSRDEQGALGLLLSIPRKLRGSALVFTDDFPSYSTVFRQGQLQQEGKGQTTRIERVNNTIRQRCSRLVRKTLSFSKKWENHYLAIKYFLVNYNFDILAKKPSLL